MPFRSVHMRYVLGVTVCVALLGCSDNGNLVHARFDLNSPKGSPYPSDRFTVSDDKQITGRRVNLPVPADCSASPTDCEDITQLALNELDGFNPDPWLSIPLDGDIDVGTIKGNIFLVSLGDAGVIGDDLTDEDGNSLLKGSVIGEVTGLNRIVWDPIEKTIHGRPDVFLDEHTRYAIVVTDRIRDVSGKPISASPEFETYKTDLARSDDPDIRWYRQALLTAEWAARQSGLQDRAVVAVSGFTTRSLTYRREKLNADILTRPAPKADLNIAPGRRRAVYPFAQIASITMNAQSQASGPPTPTPIPLAGAKFVPGAVGRLAFGRFDAPDYLVHPGEHIPSFPTQTGTPSPQGTQSLHFALSVPTGRPPPAGWPVIIFNVGNGGSRFRSITDFGSIPNSHGFAVIAIDLPGSGQGPATTLTLTMADGSSTTIPAPGRGFDQDGDGLIGLQEGDDATGVHRLRASEAADQLSSDLLSLARTIQNGIDVDADGAPDLDPSRIYFLGQSAGSNGIGFFASTAFIKAAVLLVPSSQVWDARMFNPANRGTLIGRELAARTPSLLNQADGLMSFGGIETSAPFYNENIPARDQPVRVNTVSGSAAIQEWYDRARWISSSGAVIAYARRTRKAPLPGTTARPILFFYARGDRNSPNPLNSEFIRAGDLKDRTVFYRHDLYFATNPTALKNPHTMWRSQGGANDTIAQAVQDMVSQFFKSDGVTIPQVSSYFEAPMTSPLPEDTGYIP